MDNQTLFDIAYKGLASQGFEQSLSAGKCAYRDPSGKRCAIGWAIPDEHYKAGFEGHGVCSIIDRVPNLIIQDEYFASILQQIHDCCITPHAMRMELCGLALKYGLTIPEVENNYVG